MAYIDRNELLAYHRAYAAKHKDKRAAYCKAWRLLNRERDNALNYLRRLRNMKDPLPRHVRKMAFLAAKYPKKRIVYV